MRWPALASLSLILWTGACGKSLEKQVQQQVRQLAQAQLNQEAVEVEDLQVMGHSAVAQVNLHTAVRMEQIDGKWVIREVRLGDRRWEPVDRWVAALQAARVAETREQVQRIADAIRRYRQAVGDLPETGGFDQVMDRLSPRFLDSAVRIDAWSRDLSYSRQGAEAFEVRSAGPDGNLGTADDIIGN